MQISFQLFMCGEPRSKHALIQKHPEIEQKIQVFLNESKERD